MHSRGDERVYFMFLPSVERNKWVSSQNRRNVSPFFEAGPHVIPAITPWPLSILPALLTLLVSLQTQEALAGLPYPTSLVPQSTNTVMEPRLWDHGKMRHE